MINIMAHSNSFDIFISSMPVKDLVEGLSGNI